MTAGEARSTLFERSAASKTDGNAERAWLFLPALSPKQTARATAPTPRQNVRNPCGVEGSHNRAFTATLSEQLRKRSWQRGTTERGSSSMCMYISTNLVRALRGCSLLVRSRRSTSGCRRDVDAALAALATPTPHTRSTTRCQNTHAGHPCARCNKEWLFLDATKSPGAASWRGRWEASLGTSLPTCSRHKRRRRHRLRRFHSRRSPRCRRRQPIDSRWPVFPSSCPSEEGETIRYSRRPRRRCHLYRKN